MSPCQEFIGARISSGYGAVRFGRATVLAHRLAYAMHYGVDPAGKFVCHRCDNPPCVNPEHLFLGSPRDNVIDMHKKGRYRIGNVRYLTVGDTTDSLSGWSRRTGVSISCIWQRLLRGQPASEAIRATAKRRAGIRLTEAMVIEIRACRAQGESQGSIARRYGMSQATVSFIVRRKTWRHI
jgi:hypothetical protein